MAQMGDGMKHIIIGTAGHVDHGKTLLTKALTGVDTDRLAEEKKRGITIENGFARLTLPNGQTASIVDVPGHERFVRNMLVGATGMDVVLLVVAADEGFMPQTREHLGILSLLGVKNGIIVVTKTDLVDEEWLEAIMEENRENVEGTFMETAPMLAVSALTGRGIEELKNQITSLVEGAEEKKSNKPFRLPVDRVFTVDGFGTVVTGTLVEGAVSIGDEVMIYPRQTKARVRGVQNHDRPEASASAGMRTALNLAGLGKGGVRRGDTVAKLNSMSLTTQIDVKLNMLRDAPFPLKHGSKLHFHHGTRELLCTVSLLGSGELEAGEEGFAQLRFSEALAAKNGDSFVVRFFSPTVTLGGGVILNTEAPHHKRMDEAAIKGLEARASGSSVKLLLQSLKELGAIKREELAKTCGLSEDDFSEALSLAIQNCEASELDGYIVRNSELEALWERTLQTLKEFHKQNPLVDGMNLGELRGRIFPKRDSAAADRVLMYFAETHGLIIKNGLTAVPGFSVFMTPDQNKMKTQLEKIYLDSGLQPPNTSDVEAGFKAKPELYRQVLARLKSEGVLISLNQQTIVHRAHYDKALETLINVSGTVGRFTLAEFRDELGISRKYALALLEYWDGAGITKKLGDTRIFIKKERG